MKIALLVVGCIVAVLVLFAAYRFYATVVGGRKAQQAVYEKIRPVVTDVQAGRTPRSERIDALAASPETRNMLFRALRDLNRANLFPTKYRTVAAIGESDLTMWLLHPNELGAIPDEIEAMKEIVREEDGKRYRFVVLRFRTKPPHWASKNGWMAGVAGPYWEGEEAIEPAPGVFSKFEAYESRPAETHFEEIEKLLLRK